jgi:hypothetical protein
MAAVGTSSAAGWLPAGLMHRLPAPALRVNCLPPLPAPPVCLSACLLAARERWRLWPGRAYSCSSPSSLSLRGVSGSEESAAGRPAPVVRCCSAQLYTVRAGWLSDRMPLPCTAPPSIFFSLLINSSACHSAVVDHSEYKRPLYLQARTARPPACLPRLCRPACLPASACISAKLACGPSANHPTHRPVASVLEQAAHVGNDTVCQVGEWPRNITACQSTAWHV